ncbi:M16 family metallopeptidase [Sulfoacidibacillus thermotolerans]|uniref:M16 family metallopeptidase n=1 Tax=Sulfoacidibacillus thermotolerans TaxID=1765684 RepID=UPI001FE91BB5|nr:pitrilysin family protein [Sulfoacidibacillus thermotolerans]
MIFRHTLRNGLRVVIEEIPFVRSVSMGIWVGTGSRDEPVQWSGISHFLEHMFFKGTHKHSARQLAEVFDQIGGEVNAYTTKEYTCYHAKVLDEHATLAIETLAEMLFDSVFDSNEIEREKEVVVEEIKMYEDDPEEIVHDLIVEQSFQAHPLSMNILGNESTLRSFGQQDLLEYIKMRYAPENMVIAISGHIDAQAMLETVERLFHPLSTSLQTLVDGDAQFCPGNLFRPKDVEQTHVCLAMPGVAYDAKESDALLLLNNILGASSSSRLFQEIREERGMAYNVFSYHSAFRDTGLLTIYFGASPTKAQSVLDLVLKQLNHFIRNGVQKNELEKAKNQLKGSLLLSLESTLNRMNRLGKNELLLRRQVEVEQVIADLDTISVDMLNQISKNVLSGPYSIVALGPKEYPVALSQ